MVTPFARSAAAMLAVTFIAGSPAAAQTSASPSAPSAPVVQPAIDGILAAFTQRPIVGLGDEHGVAQQQDFYAALVRDPRFARDVGNVVVEFGGALHQAVIDRYVAGEAVPYLELRKVWTDTVGWVPTVRHIGFVNFFAQVRAVNQTLPPAARIKVWLGEPPIDWSTIRRRSDLNPISVQRDSYPAQLIVEQILAKNKKALVIYGGAHFGGPPPPVRSSALPGSETLARQLMVDIANGTPDYALMVPELAERTRQQLPRLQGSLKPLGSLKTLSFSRVEGAFDVYTLTFANGTREFRVNLDASGKLVEMGLRSADGSGRPLAALVQAKYPNAFFFVGLYIGYPDRACRDQFERQTTSWPVPALVTSVASLLPQSAQCAGSMWNHPRTHAALYLGPAVDLTLSPMIPDLYLDEDYRTEIARRNQIRGTASLTTPVRMQEYSVTPRKYLPDQAAPSSDEAERLRAFTTHDANHDGRLDRAEYRAVLTQLGYASQLDTLFAQRDVDKDGFVSAEEYRTPIPQR